MPKFIQEDITAEHLTQYLAEQDDFTLEVRTLRQLADAGCTVSHGGIYVDPTSEKPRQFDLRATITRGSRRVAFAIECKRLQPYYPLLLSRIPRTVGESFHDVLRVRRDSVPATRVDRKREANSVFPAGSHVGKSTTQVGRSAANLRQGSQPEWVDGDKDVYEKWAQALSSCAELIAQYGPPTTSTDYSAVVFPILVVPDRTLWVADYDEGGRAQSVPYLVDATSLYVGRSYKLPGQAGLAMMTHLQIFTESGLASELLVMREEPWWQLRFG